MNQEQGQLSGNSAPPETTGGSPPVVFGPFAPPANYEFEPELRKPPPREVPVEIKKGIYAKKRLRAVLGVLTAAAICIVLSRFKIVAEWGQYFLPLAYLFWIGLGLAVISALMWVQNKLSRGPFRYVEEGIPIVARVTALVKQPSAIIEGQVASYEIRTLIEYRASAESMIERTELRSPQFSTNERDKFTISFKVGDYVTAVYLPENLGKTLQLYGYLGLRPGLGLIRGDDPAGEKVNLWKVPAVILFVFGFFGMIGWDLYAYGRFFPINFGFWDGFWPMMVGGIVLGGAFIGIIVLEGWREQARVAERNRTAAARGDPIEVSQAGAWNQMGWFVVLIVISGCFLMGGLTGMCWCFTYNALADNSPAKLKDVQITDMIMTTHEFIFREYTLEYVFPGSNEKQKLMTTPQHLGELLRAGGKDGTAEIHDGRLGWAWVKTVRPAPANVPAMGKNGK